MKLEKKVAIITGGASGIGRATAELFAEAGAMIAIVDRNREAAESVASEIGRNAMGVAADVSRAAEIAAAVEAIRTWHGRVDILVNNAGYGIPGSILEVEEEDWDALMATNLKGVYLFSRAVIPIMTRQGAGTIINTGSYTAFTAIRNRAAYIASKGGVVALTRAMALDHIDANIRVNCVAPGTISSPYFDQMFAASPNPAAMRGELDGRAPLGRMGRPEEIAKAILFLAADESSFVVGSALIADGGSSAW